jgi:urease accessory protein
MRMTSDGGLSFLLDLPEARLLHNGEGLVLSDGRIVEVRAAPEALYRVHPKSSRHLLQLAWHLGNRHCPTQIDADTLLIRRDHTLRAMLEGLGATVEEIDAPFDPEGGAYSAPHGHHHD